MIQSLWLDYDKIYYLKTANHSAATRSVVFPFENVFLRLLCVQQKQINNQLTDCISTAMHDIILCLCVCFGTSEGGREEGGREADWGGGGGGGGLERERESERERCVCIYVSCWLHVL